ncbi:ABC-type branched-subunit amino acid transport system ATPase component [Streptomyces sp. V4I2]|nr:ABC-type branched-subunit amino acid transport system ATPase component [Streptomyces sp. V4I2]
MTPFGRTDVQPVIQVRDLTMAYGDVDVLRGVDLDIHRGEVFPLLGPNGAGKTTTVEILEGFRQRSGGEVSVLATDPGRPAPRTAGRRHATTWDASWPLARPTRAAPTTRRAASPAELNR